MGEIGDSFWGQLQEASCDRNEIVAGGDSRIQGEIFKESEMLDYVN